MSEALSGCSYARTVLRKLVQDKYVKIGSKKTLARGAVAEISDCYNNLFQTAPNMYLSHVTVVKNWPYK